MTRRSNAIRKRRGRSLCFGIAAAALIASAGEGQAADSDNGRLIAEHWCAACHVIAPQQQQASDAVPTFAQIGESYDEAALAAFLASPQHSRMANLSLTRREIDDLVAYIKLQVR